MSDLKTARFDTKMSAVHKHMLERAARLRGYKTLSEYVITTMVQAAKETIDEFAPVVYSIEDKQRINEILSQPTELSKSFLRASKMRNTMITDEDRAAK